MWYACMLLFYYFSLFFFFNDTATTDIYTLSLHDALPIRVLQLGGDGAHLGVDERAHPGDDRAHLHRARDRKSTRLNSSHITISYAVFCWKKKKTTAPGTRWRQKERKNSIND